MKSGYAVAFLLTVLLLGYGVVRAAKNERPMARVLCKLLSVAVLAVLSNLAAMLSVQESACVLAYGIFFGCIDWLLYYMLLFVVEYTDMPMPHGWKKPLWGILWVDTASMLANFLLGHAFTCIPVQTEAGELYYRIQSGVFYEVHLVLSYLLVALTVVLLLVRAVRVPAENRAKYFWVMLIFGVIVAADAGYVFLNQVVDISILFFAVGGYALYYYAMVHAERELISNSMRVVAAEMEEALLIFDADLHCTYINEGAVKLFGRTEHTREEAKQVFFSWCEQEGLFFERDYRDDKDFCWDEDVFHLRVEYHCVRDKRGQRMSSFFVIHDHTLEVNGWKRERYRATHDALTQLYNKEYFYERVGEYLREYPGEQFLLIGADVKNFKLINDVFGPEAGDEVLVRIARAIEENVKPGEIYGRVESDCFALLMRKSDYKEALFAEDSEKMRPINCAATYPVTVYIGVYEVTERSLPVSVMCDRAFMAINAMKRKELRKVAYYDKKLRDSILEEQELSGELNRAIESGEFCIHLQPQISVDGEVSGAEVLVRWRHAEKGMLMPGSFIPVLERSGQIVKLDYHVWELACRQLKRWKERGRTDIYLSVNISTRDFYYTDVYEAFMGLVKKYDIRPENLKLEITETAIMMNLEEQLRLIEKLRQAGFVVEMDDFGSGYSSLNMLKEICVDTLKVDMAFLERTGDEARSRKILQMVIELSKELGMTVITEGVETETQVQYLTQMGCDVFQGYYFAKPMEVQTFEQRYMEDEQQA